MAQLKPSDFITLRKKRMDWMAGTDLWIQAVLGKWEIDNWKRSEFQLKFCLALRRNNILLVREIGLFSSAHTHSPKFSSNSSRTIRNVIISIRTAEPNVSTPSHLHLKLPWAPRNEKSPRLWLDLGFLDENGHEFLDLWAVFHHVSPVALGRKTMKHPSSFGQKPPVAKLCELSHLVGNTAQLALSFKPPRS